MKADLHIHSIYSNDGEHSISKIINMILESGVDTFSITDHNCVGGSREAKGMEIPGGELNFIPGIEIDCNYKGTDLHLLGYQIDMNSRDFDTLELDFRKKHMEAIPKMISNLDKLGIEIDQDELMRESGGEPPSAELFAELLIKNPDQHSNPRLKPYLPGGERSDMPLVNFYLDFFAQGKPAYVKFEHLDFKDAVALVRNNGGIPVVAHPGLNLEGKEALVNELMDQGAAGLEVFNNYHSDSQIAYFAEQISKRAALMTSGSDFHGKIKPLISLGQYKILVQYSDYLEQSVRSIMSVHADKSE